MGEYNLHSSRSASTWFSTASADECGKTPCEADQDRLEFVVETPSCKVEVSTTPSASVLVTPRFAGGVSSS